MSSSEIKPLLTYNRFPQTYDKFFFTVLYLPFGLVLFVLRTILALSILLLGTVLPDRPVVHNVINKIACLTLGISVNVENPSERKNVKVYVSNSLSAFDYLAVFTTIGAVSPGPEINPMLSKSIGIHYFGSPSNLTNFKKAISTYVNEKANPVYFTPEGKITNGKGLLKFKIYPFSIVEAIQPVVIQIKRPFLEVSLTTIGSGYWTDVFFFMFSPVTIYNLKFLPVQSRGNSSDEDFAENVRSILSQKLNVPLVNASAADVAEWEKRKLNEQNSQITTTVRQPNPLIKQQALQVKEVLPHVPLNVIYDDLMRTKSVDGTISNILEGHISFVPETRAQSSSTSPEEPSTSFSKQSVPSTPPTGSYSKFFNTAASTFAKSAQDRTKSFQERKSELIANARRRYIEKHNLNIPV